MIVEVYDEEGNRIFKGLKPEAMAYIKKNNIDRRAITMKLSETKPTREEVEQTTAPIEPKPAGFFKKIFNR